MVSKDFMSRAIEFGIRRRERERKGNQESGKEGRTDQGDEDGG